MEALAASAKGVVHRVVARQRGGVRGRCRRAQRAGADLDHHDRLAVLLRQRQRGAQARAVAAAFQVGHDDVGFRVLRQPGQAVGQLHVRLVARGGPQRQAQSALARQAVGVDAERARLADQADAPRLDQARVHRRREGGVDLVAGTDDAQAVGAQQADAGCLRAHRQHVLLRRAFGTHLGVAR